jgi:hypothetical protein
VARRCPTQGALRAGLTIAAGQPPLIKLPKFGCVQIVFAAASNVSHTIMSQVLDVILCNRNLASSFDRLVGVSEHSQRFVALPAPRRRVLLATNL